MRELLLNSLFPLITSLRKLEMTQLVFENYNEAEKIQNLNRLFSKIRDKIVTAQLSDISQKNNDLFLLLAEINQDINNYLSLKLNAKNQFAKILNSLPTLLTLLNSLVINNK